jgi:hypothetical protein
MDMTRKTPSEYRIARNVATDIISNIAKVIKFFKILPKTRRKEFL